MDQFDHEFIFLDAFLFEELWTLSLYMVEHRLGVAGCVHETAVVSGSYIAKITIFRVAFNCGSASKTLPVGCEKTGIVRALLLHTGELFIVRHKINY